MSYLINVILALAVRFGYLKKTGGMYYINKYRPSLFDRTQAKNLTQPWGVDLCRWTRQQGELVERRDLLNRMDFATRQH